MSKIKRYIAFCEENGYTNEEGEVDSMEYAEEYMKTQEYQREHDWQSRKVMDDGIRKDIKELQDYYHQTVVSQINRLWGEIEELKN